MPLIAKATNGRPMSIKISGQGFVSKAENTAIVACSMKRNANQHTSAIFKPAIALVAFKPPNQPGECVINDDRADDCEHVSADIVRTLDVSHRARVQIQPFLAEDSVPAPADDLIHDDQDPNCKMIDLRVHENLRDYAGVRSSIANRLRHCSLGKYGSAS